MDFKRIGILLMITLFLFGCPGEDPEKPHKEEETNPPPPTQVTVTFDVDGGTPSTINPITINQGSSLGTKYPANPQKSGLAFAGWYAETDILYSLKYINSTVINSNITLKARWLPQKENEYDVGSFIPPTVNNGVGTSITNNLTYQSKSNVTKLSPIDSTVGYGWNVVSYSLSNYIGKEITITLSMDVWISATAKIAWQINNGSAAADAWGGAWKVVAGDNADGSEIEANKWVHLEGTVTGTPASGNNNGNLVYLSGGDTGQLKEKPIDIYIANFVMKIRDSTSPVIPPNTILLTVGSNKDLTKELNNEMKGKTISTWVSSNPAKVAVNSSGIITSNITSFTTEEGGNQQYRNGPAEAQVTITATAADGKTQTFIIIATTEAQEYIMDLPPLKEKFPASILIGNIAATNDSGVTAIINQSLIRHFNALTSENDMKPSSISTGKGTYNWTNADKFVNAATASGFKVIGHTLLWHNQIPAWQQNIGTSASSPPTSEQKAEALTAMKEYVTAVVTHFKGKIYSWDVLNEAFPDSASGGDWKIAMRQENPWFKVIGSDFVYEAFLAARLADPDAKLYYNDYNTDQTGRATVIRDMVRDVNQKYKEAFPSETQLLIEGIGMQEHHNTGVTAASIRAALNMFRPLGVKIAVSEIDVLGQDWGSFSSVGQGANKHASSTVTNNGLMTQASLYKQYMDVYKDFTDIIERISIWGITDDKSWRSAGLPLLFDDKGKAKPAYYKFVEGIPTP